MVIFFRSTPGFTDFFTFAFSGSMKYFTLFWIFFGRNLQSPFPFVTIFSFSGVLVHRLWVDWVLPKETEEDIHDKNCKLYTAIRNATSETGDAEVEPARSQNLHKPVRTFHVN